MTAVKITTYVAPAAVFAGNEYTDTVIALAEADAAYAEAGSKERAAAEITVPTADAPKHATRFAKAANALGHGSRKRSESVDEKAGTTTTVYTLGKMRTVKPVESASVDPEVTGAE